MQPAEIRQESLVSYLPLSHIAAQIYDLWTGIQWGEQVSFAQPDALKVNVQEQDFCLALGKKSQSCSRRATLPVIRSNTPPNMSPLVSINLIHSARRWNP